MQISEATNKQGIIEDIDFMMGTDSTTYPTTHKIRNINGRYREILSWIFSVYDGWQFNDSNQSNDTLYASQTLTSGTSVYTIPASALVVVGAEILLNGSTTWQKLIPITPEEIQKVSAISEFNKNSSTPRYYILRGDSIEILPPPNYTQATSLRIYFLQDVVSFAITDTSPVPGIAAHLHRALSIGGSLDYAMAKKPEMIDLLRFEWDGNQDKTGREGGYKKRIKQFYASRFAERKHKISVNDATNEFR